MAKAKKGEKQRKEDEKADRELEARLVAARAGVEYQEPKNKKRKTENTTTTNTTNNQPSPAELRRADFEKEWTRLMSSTSTRDDARPSTLALTCFLSSPGPRESVSTP